MNQFNRIFRILWSKTKEQWVVTSELEGPGGKKQGKGLVSVFCAALVAAGMLSAAPEEAQAITGCSTATTFVLATPITNSCTLTAADTLTVSNTGVINGTGTKAAVYVDFNQTSVAIDNSGDIKATDIPALYLDSLGGTGVVSNNVGALIQATGVNPKLNAIHVPSTLWNGTAALPGNLQTGSQINNSGTIDRYANMNNVTTSVSVAAIGGGGALAGILNNTSTGVISATLNMGGLISASASTSVIVRGLDFSGSGISGVLNNSGLITGTFNKSLGFKSSASSFAVEGVNTGALSGTLTNDGSITASNVNSANHVSASISITARGIAGIAGTPYNGSLTNNGNISANVSNTGNVVPSSSSRARLVATGLQFGQSAAASIINSNTGSITATADNTGAGNSSSVANLVTAVGMDVGGKNIWQFGGIIQNSGSISAMATATAPLATPSGGNDLKAIGIRIKNLTGVIDNYASISATATANNNTGTSNGMTAAGIQFGSSGSGKASATNGVLNNYGTISATATGVARTKNVYALSSAGVWGGGLTINNQTGGVLKGNIALSEFKAPKANVNNAGLIDLPFILGVSSSITGNYTQQTGGVLRIEAMSVSTGTSSTTGYAWINTGGVASFANSGTIDVNVPAGSTLIAGDMVTAVQANAGIVSPAGGFVVTDNSGTIDFQASVVPGWAGIGSQKLQLTVVA